MNKLHVSRNKHGLLSVTGCLVILLWGPAFAQDTGSSGPSSDALQDQLDDQKQQIGALATAQTASGASIDDLQKLLTEQKKQLDAQAKQIVQAQSFINTQTTALQSLQTRLDELATAMDQEREPTEEEIAMKERLPFPPR